MRRPSDLRTANECPPRGILPVLVVAALGYFVDAFDIVVFSVVRHASLRALGASQQDVMSTGIYLLNIQLAGMVVGGCVWGVIADKVGRRATLLGCILFYSLATFGNAFVSSIEAYAILRFVAGFGLAGELGAAITLVSETLPPRFRAIGNSVVGVCGVAGGIFAAYLADRTSWQAVYVVGGLLGFSLLATRVQIEDPAVYLRAKRADVPRGSLRLLVRSRGTLVRYVYCLFLSGPNWLGMGLFIGLVPEICRENLTRGQVSVGQATIVFLLGLALGEAASALLLITVESRRLVIAAFLVMWTSSCIGFLRLTGVDHRVFLVACASLGFGAGYWTIFLTYAAELFGTNLRALAATSLPNISRAKIIPASALLTACVPHVGLRSSLGLIAAVLVCGAAWALAWLPETSERSLEYLEEMSL